MNEALDWEPRRRARRRALQALYQHEITGDEVDGIIIQFLDTQDFSSVDEAYFKQLVHGVASEAASLRDDLQPLLDRPFRQLDTMERILLLLGAWHFRFDPEVPWPVVVNEAVDLANRFGSAQTHTYVNAVLDRAARAWNVPGARPATDD
ncbi:MAG: transcription antitermination factor NusB [Xanthomonadales bacterium]|jgi:N utilization substance protein B|nr:transcription antitermination factor NusB [Xanthomonadales bacterium]